MLSFFTGWYLVYISDLFPIKLVQPFHIHAVNILRQILLSETLDFPPILVFPPKN